VLTTGAAALGFLVLTRLPAAGGYSPLLAAVTLVGFGTAGTAFGAMVTASVGMADGAAAAGLATLIALAHRAEGVRARP
jgi:hypothetical protein